ncbi:hypothetical protein D3C84_1037050 [compost metagenome]
MLKQFGSLPIGYEEWQLESKIYLYDPDGLPGLSSLSDIVNRDEGKVTAPESNLVPSHCIEINGDVYVIPCAYFQPEFFEAIPGRFSE